MAEVITAKLTKTFIAERIKSTGERQTFRDAECRGLILRVGSTGKMSWAYDYRNAAGKRQSSSNMRLTRLITSSSEQFSQSFGATDRV